MHFLTFLAIRALLFPFSFLSYAMLHRCGNVIGNLLYRFCIKWRKQTFSHLSLAFYPNLSERKMKQLAKGAFANLAITCLEYGKLSRETDISRIASCENPKPAQGLMEKGIPIIFFCGHQANWELLFLEGTSRMPGVAIGRPIDNAYLYRWILSIRQRYGGKIVSRKNAVKEGLRALRNKAFLGIVGDQGMPDSGFSSLFFGKRAWSSPLPAILSYRTGSPIMVATLHREHNRYRIHYSDPIWPDTTRSMEEETKRMMEEALSLFEQSIRAHPEQWLWIHNRWKQQTLAKVSRKFRHESICVVLPKDPTPFASLLSELKKIYPLEFFTLFVHEGTTADLEGAEVIEYRSLAELKEVRDFRFKLLFNCIGDPSISSHFKSLSVLEAVDCSAGLPRIIRYAT